MNQNNIESSIASQVSQSIRPDDPFNENAQTDPALQCISFECTACGKCCDRGPHLAIDELASNAQHFIYSLRMKAIAGSKSSQMGVDTLKNIRGVFPSFQHEGQTYHLMASVVEDGYSSRLGQGCPQRIGTPGAVDQGSDAGRCAIHAQRPRSCRTSPFNPSLDGASQWLPLADMVAAKCAIVHQSPESATGNVIWIRRDGVVDEGYRQALELSRADQARDAQLTRHCIMFASAGFFVPPIEAVMEAGKRGHWVSTSIIPALVMVATDERLGLRSNREAAVEHILRSQIAAIDVAVKGAVERKRSEDRPHTQMLRKFSSDYVTVTQHLGRFFEDVFSGAWS